MAVIDDSVFLEDEMAVMRYVGEWYTVERHELGCGGNPFANWYPIHPQDIDLSWLALGFDLSTGEYLWAHLLHYGYYGPNQSELTACESWIRHSQSETWSQSSCSCQACMVTARADGIIMSMAKAVDVPATH